MIETTKIVISYTILYSLILSQANLFVVLNKKKLSEADGKPDSHFAW